jgi:serine/threonine protein kinase
MIDSVSRQIKIIDFGLATRASGLAKRYVGTEAYASPESMEGPYNYEKQEVWSLGVLLYKMLYRRFPFESIFGPAGTDISDVLAENSNHRVTLNANRLITRLLNADPKKRPSLSQIMDDRYFLLYKLAETKICYERYVRGVLRSCVASGGDS